MVAIWKFWQVDSIPIEKFSSEKHSCSLFLRTWLYAFPSSKYKISTLSKITEAWLIFVR